MTFLDAYGLVALVADEPAASEVETLLRAGDCRVVAMNLAEAVYVCRREHALEVAEVRGAIDPLLLSGELALARSDEAETWEAATLRATRYHRTSCPLSLADCFLVAHARLSGEAIATADPHVASAARAEGVDIIALPDRRGRRPA